MMNIIDYRSVKGMVALALLRHNNICSFDSYSTLSRLWREFGEKGISQIIL